MKLLENKEDIDRIVMRPTAIVKCQIGQDWYNNQLEIIFVPSEYYPDYIEVQNWIMENVDGKEMNIEEVVDEVYKHMMIYKPAHLCVHDIVEGNKVHFNVEVTKVMEYEED